MTNKEKFLAGHKFYFYMFPSDIFYLSGNTIYAFSKFSITNEPIGWMHTPPTAKSFIVGKFLVSRMVTEKVLFKQIDFVP